MVTLLIVAFLAGIVTILSPCILPILPILLSASTPNERHKPLGIIIGLIISFSFFTLSLSTIVAATGISPDLLRYAAIIIIIFFGLTMIIPSLETYVVVLMKRVSHLGESVQKQSQRTTGFASGLILGFALGLIWTPCAGSILATITALAATHSITVTAVIITIAYSAGAALPMLIIAYGGTKIINSIQQIGPYTKIIRTLFGILMICSALAIAFHYDVILQQYVARYIPSFTIEEHTAVEKELAMLKPSRNTNFANKKNSAPELVGITDWLNSPPLSLKALQGTIVLIDFWTYSCINCIRSLPYIKKWYDTYKDKGLTIIGVHTPEFEFEKNRAHVEDAIKRFDIHYPVAMDNDYKTWQAYDNHYWPAHYLIDKQGTIVEHHFGEGNYTETENAIRQLLNLQPLSASVPEKTTHITTPETYLGYERAQQYKPDMTIQKDKVVIYSYKGTLIDDHVELKGAWLIKADSIQAESNTSSLTINFLAQQVCIVMESPKPQPVTVLLDGKPVPMHYQTKDMDKDGHIIVNAPRMYEIIDMKNNYSRHLLTLEFQRGTIAYVFTFG
jgi:cytochrome c biogenesis protein CcdA/thiol-disulfide isomerase/thioredoxin